LIKELQIGAPNISKIERIGMEKESGNGAALKRPIKLIMNSEEDKEKVFRNEKECCFYIYEFFEV
jgi:hypothetical protein